MVIVAFVFEHSFQIEMRKFDLQCLQFMSSLPFLFLVIYLCLLVFSKDHHKQTTDTSTSSLLIAFNYRWHLLSLAVLANLHLHLTRSCFLLKCLLTRELLATTTARVMLCVVQGWCCWWPPADHKSSSPWRPSFGEARKSRSFLASGQSGSAFFLSLIPIFLFFFTLFPWRPFPSLNDSA